VGTAKASWKFHLSLGAGYLLLALLLTWPTVSHFTTHVPGDGIDDPAIVWNLWWIKYSLLNQPQNPFLTHFMFYPIGINLAFYTLTTLNGLTTIPLLLNFGEVTASNLHLWFSLTVGGYGAYLLTLYLLLAPPWGFTMSRRVARWAAILAGIVYAFGSNKLFYIALGQFNIASTHWIPYAILFFIKMHREAHNLRWSALSALFLVMQAWTELTYASFLLVFMAFYWLYWLLTDLARRVVRWPYLKAGFLLAFLFGLGISPFLAVMLPDMRAEGDFFVVGGGFAGNFSADLAGFLVPTMHHPLFGDLIAQTGIENFDKGQHIYLGYSLLILAGLGFYTHRRDPGVRFWLLAGLLFALLALGPQIVVNGRPTGLAGPFTILQNLPFFKGNRYPSRYSVMLFLSLAPLAAFGFAALAGKLNSAKRQVTLLALGLILLFLFEHLSVPLPQSNMIIPEPYQRIAQDNGDFTLLDIPFGWRNGFRLTGAWTTGIMFGQFYQTRHQKPLLGGNTSRNPEFKFQYFAEAPIINSLTRLETGHELSPETWKTDPQYAADVLRFFNIKYIVVRPEEPGFQNNPQATIPYIERVLPAEKLSEDPGLILYRVNLPPWPDQVDLLAASPLTNLYFAEGWGLPHNQIVAQRKEARLLVPLDGRSQRLRVRVRLPDNAEMTDGELWLTLNGWRSETLSLSPEWRTLTLSLPAEAVSPGLNDIRLHFSRVMPVAPQATEVTVISAGEEGGNLGHIYLDGVDVSPNQRGYNIAIIDPEGGLLQVANFDTHLDPEASHALAEFISAAPDHALIAVAAQDEASGDVSKGAKGDLSEEAVTALQSIGAQVDLRGQFRASHALIGGKTSDRILEGSDPSGYPIKLTTGLGLIEPRLAAIFESIGFEAVE
jgi:hypothetical protein